MYILYKIDNLNIIYVASIPQKNIFRPKNEANIKQTTVSTITKNSEFLALKTVSKEEKLQTPIPAIPSRTRTFSIHKTIPSPHKKYEVNSFMGKKRELKYVRKQSSPPYGKNAPEEKITFCLNCTWKFPERMSVMRKNQHINKCFEGKGNLDIMHFLEEQKIKIYRNLPVKKLVKLVRCPICGKDIEESNCKAKQSHLIYCTKHI